MAPVHGWQQHAAVPRSNTGPGEGSMHSFGSSTGSSTTSPLAAPLSLVPEKGMLGHQIRSTVPAQFWGASVASASAPDGALASSVSDPAPLPLLAGTGLSRPHLVMVTQALRLPGRPSLPGLPSVCLGHGGVVLDRVLAHVSGDAWWGVLSGRAKLGKLVAQRADLAAAVSDPSSYSMVANTRMQLRRNTVLRTRVDWTPATPASSSRRRRPGSAPSAPAANGAAASPPSASSTTFTTATPRGGGFAAPPLSLSCQLRTRLGPRAEARADLAIAQRTSVAHDAAAGTHGSAAAVGTVTPLTLGLQAGTPVTSRAPLVWRVGALQVTAPPTVALAGADAGAAAAGGATRHQSLQSAVYVQGSAALQGERYLWRAPKNAPRRRTPAADGSAAATTPLPPPPTLGPHNPVRQAASYMFTRMGGREEDGGNGNGGRRRQAASSSAGANGGGGGKGGSGGSGGGGSGGGSAPFGVELPSAGAVQEALMDATQSISRLRDDVTQATQWVGGGGLVEQLEWQTAGSGAQAAAAADAAKRRRQQQRDADSHSPAPWSSFVGEPHLKVAGVAGITARAPVIRLTHGSASKTAAALADPPTPLASALPVRVEWMQDLGLKRFLSRSRDGGAAAAGLAEAGGGGGDGGGGGGGGGRGAAGSLRPFATAAASLQLGRFSRWLVDFTRVSAQLDAGLWGPAIKGSTGSVQQQLSQAASAPPTPSQRHPAFALGDTGAWHSLSLSLSQQLVGPLRFVADWRCELASSRPLALPPLRTSSSSSLGGADGGGAGSGDNGSSSGGPLAAAGAAGSGVAGAVRWLPGAARGVAAHVSGMRPQLLEAVYALDLAVPGAQGAVRLVAWYAPQRREGMLELRLF